MRDQIKLTFNMGAEALPAAFTQCIVAEAVRLCGGCYCPSGTGYWNELDQTREHVFYGNAIPEETLVIELTCEPEKVERVVTIMRRVIAAAVKSFALPVNWVHVTETPIVGRHFSVAEVLAEMDQAA